MKKTPQTLAITGLSHDGRGIATIQGKTTFVTGALPQETVTAIVTKKHKRYNEAQTLEIITPAPERVTPTCAHFSICGGCSLQHMDSAAQVQFKQQVLLEQLKHFGKVEPEIILPPLSGNPWHYRRKARLGVFYDKNTDTLLLGFRKKNSNVLANIQNCPVLDAKVGTHLTALNHLIRSLTQFAAIPQIEVNVSDTQVALVFRHLNPLTKDDITKLCEFAKTHAMTFYLQPNAPAAIHKIWPQQSTDGLSYNLPDYQIEVNFNPLDFIQVNSELNQALLKQALQLLDPQPTDTVLDLFCGLGNFTLPIARLAKQVTGIEGDKIMVKRALENAHHNKLSNAEFFTENLMNPSPDSAWINRSYNKILLDPPRIGAKEILPFFKKFAAKRIIYVSCNPSTLARDAGELVYNHKYKLKVVGVINMFPHTSHIEAIAVFEK